MNRRSWDDLWAQDVERKKCFLPRGTPPGIAHRPLQSASPGFAAPVRSTDRGGLVADLANTCRGTTTLPDTFRLGRPGDAPPDLRSHKAGQLPSRPTRAFALREPILL